MFHVKNFDYSSAGWYFITICIKNRQEYFGNIINNRMNLNKYGEIVNKYWLEIKNKFKNITLDIYQIMPNHIHGIIVIKQKNIVGVSFMKSEMRMKISKSNRHMGLMNQTPTIGLIIRYFKSKCTFEIHKYGLNNNLWQRNYYDHIIRNESSLNNIREYIQNNPKKWDNDEENPKNIK
ncbi:hypothetical protein CO006_03220 [Candidatus Roizmanbacteria bacterium CG_4_8_14_3_um_filter_35_14]|uniref:Transposase IS200-like domain-containing protein n=1 Tax=Candidatus Roizmanbacteria bacterium CG23_combo_of_CG06-09_8_20_14_all_35_49 TaxID=1974863 RepID=A0A2G9Y9T9_9BACT|nr:MAG: hypothetical protein COX47_00740 [Candidatus Roizmanbacteria bacterium CG23_combo_of_CG06-09_8_20_14_all_35_49]PJC82474.1 MAG: hypothetical protein CO006_03220 [Candidatus Roizmanbacteria bacterium CG_4_8_14_3_um_filter_35_14]